MWDPQTQGKDFLGKLIASLPELEEQVLMDLSQYLESLCEQL